MATEITADEVRIDVGRAAPMNAFLARPADGAHPLVLVCAELWGLTDQVRDITRQVAELGYVAVAPNLYHRSGPETASGFAESDANRTRAFELLGRLTRDDVEADLRACAAHARDHANATDKTGVLGFSLGGHIAFFAATRLDLAAAAIYYPGWLPVAGTALSRPTPLLDDAPAIAARDVRTLMFFAELDHVIDADQRAQISAALDASGARHEEIVYPGAQHAFFFPGRAPYDKTAADDSWTRVQDLFRTELTQ
ncbi:dienelactone hydrolase family protein [Actinomadura opuntiae]|uniref:dienelactone hydrolase family protein n=1 Tax=Actinomadura sp. OS1-43 TaxID=604315 RepID=UPI00255AC313|nr:dienelactone hydrolase family protein [Actinomadura sp. OS1-43]MDL4813866.1 dienelactone hydrolase family protein [Actinomadura sp. OS1-43]